jgi:hypothetical protein
MAAAARDRSDVVRMLVQFGADVHLDDKVWYYDRMLPLQSVSRGCVASYAVAKGRPYVCCSGGQYKRSGSIIRDRCRSVRERHGTLAVKVAIVHVIF